jgi:hypothetical protein
VPDYWFDAEPLLEKPAQPERPAYAQLRKGLGQGASLKARLAALKDVELGGLVKDAFARTPGQLELFAQANGLGYRYFSFDQRPGMIFPSGEQREMVSSDGPPYVEFGNCHSRGQEMAYLFGYVAVRHGLDLPHLVLDARANDATPPAGSRVYAKKQSYSSLDANYRGSGSATPMTWVRALVEPLDLGPQVDQHTRVFVEKGRGEEARRFLTGTALQYFLGVAQHFDAEIVDGWALLYLYGAEVSGTDPDRWAWAFSVASRLLDQVEAWARTTPALPHAPPAGSFARPSFYTADDAPLPAELATGPWQPAVGRNAFWDFVWDD